MRIKDFRQMLLDYAAGTLKSYDTLKSHLNSAHMLNNLSLAQSFVGAGMTLASLGKSMIVNAGKTVPKILPAAPGYVPLQAFNNAGKMVSPHVVANSSRVARDVGAATIGAATAGKTVATSARDTALKKTSQGVSWTLDPAGTGGRKITEVVKEASDSIYHRVQDLHDMVRDIDVKYRDCCPNL